MKRNCWGCCSVLLCPSTEPIRCRQVSGVDLCGLPVHKMRIGIFKRHLPLLAKYGMGGLRMSSGRRTYQAVRDSGENVAYRGFSAGSRPVPAVSVVLRADGCVAVQRLYCRFAGADRLALTV